MTHKIEANKLRGHGPIKILYPGDTLNENDSGMGSIGRIDYALFKGANIIPMHPHVNDEILTYLRSGNVEHEDSEGISKSLNNTTLMLMKAGKRFYHEEKILDLGESLEGLQIFIRPKTKDLNPEVHFLNLEDTFNNNVWRLIASPSPESILQFTSKTWIYDMRISANKSFSIPKLGDNNLNYLIFVFNGTIRKERTLLNKKDSFIFTDNEAKFTADVQSDIVLFVTDMSSKTFNNGMFSGNVK